MSEQDHQNHGHSVAAWTAVTILLVASLVMSFAVIFPSVLWFGIGVVIAVIGAVAGKVLSMAGYGAAKAGTQGEHGHHTTLPGGNQVESGTS